MADGVGNPVQGCAGSSADAQSKAQDPQQHWVKFKLQDDKGKPVAGVTVNIVLPDGSSEEHTSDDKGMIEIANVQPGNCKIDMDWDDHVLHETAFIQ